MAMSKTYAQGIVTYTLYVDKASLLSCSVHVKIPSGPPATMILQFKPIRVVRPFTWTSNNGIIQFNHPFAQK